MFNPFESSRTLGTPLELYLFQTATQTFAYCDGDDDKVFGGLTYQAVPITHGPITSSGSLDRSSLEVRLSDALPLIGVLRAFASSVTSLVVRQGHATDPDAQFLVAWAGQVLSNKAGDPGERVLTCQPVSTGLKRVGLRRNWQYPCPHVLYGAQCRASLPYATVTANGTATGRNTLSLPSGWYGTKPLAKFVGGLCAWGSEIRTILGATDTSLTLNGPASFAPNTTLSLSLGCDHLRDDCSTLHKPSDEAEYGGGNIRNFGGQPFIPTTNPVGFVSNYS